MLEKGHQMTTELNDSKVWVEVMIEKIGSVPIAKV